MRIEAWTQAIIADVKLRDLTQLVPLLGGLVQATQTLRLADWNDFLSALAVGQMNPGVMPVNKTPPESFDFPAPHSSKQQEADGIYACLVIAPLLGSQQNLTQPQ